MSASRKVKKRAAVARLQARIQSESKSATAVKVPPSLVLFQGGQVQIRLSDEATALGMLLQLRGASCNITPIASGDKFRRINVRTPYGLRYRLARTDEPFLTLTPSPYHYTTHDLETDDNQPFHLWLSEDAGLPEVEQLVDYPIIVEHLDTSGMRIHLPDGWSCVRDADDERPYHVSSRCYGQKMEVIAAALSQTVDANQIKWALKEIDSVRDWTHIAPALGRELLAIEQTLLSEKDNPCITTAAEQRGEEPTAEECVRCLRQIIALDTTSDGAWGPCAELAARFLKVPAKC